jgi:hypothetical protein
MKTAQKQGKGTMRFGEVGSREQTPVKASFEGQ